MGVITAATVALGGAIAGTVAKGAQAISANQKHKAQKEMRIELKIILRS